MITIRTSELNDDELTELLRVFVIAKNQLCKDSYPSNCEKCQFKKVCNNFRYNIRYLSKIYRARGLDKD